MFLLLYQAPLHAQDERYHAPDGPARGAVGAGGSIVVAINRDSDTPEGSWQASLTLTCALDCGGHDCRGFLLTEMTDAREEKLGEEKVETPLPTER